MLLNKMLCGEANGDDMHPRVDTLIMAMNANSTPLKPLLPLTLLSKTDPSSGLFGMWQTMHAVALDTSAIYETKVCLSARLVALLGLMLRL